MIYTANLKYTEKITNGLVWRWCCNCRITQLKRTRDIVYVEVETLDQTWKDEVLGVEAVKDSFDLFCLSREIIEFNDVRRYPRSVNQILMVLVGW
jgi:glycine cleavage system H lipoate-binding protein